MARQKEILIVPGSIFVAQINIKWFYLFVDPLCVREFDAIKINNYTRTKSASKFLLVIGGIRTFKGQVSSVVHARSCYVLVNGKLGYVMPGWLDDYCTRIDVDERLVRKT